MSEKKWLIIISFIVILFLGFRVMNKEKKSNDDIITQTNYIMGTIIKIDIYDKVDKKILEDSFDIIRNIEKKMSLNIASSEINDLNKNGFNDFVSVSDQTAFVIEKSMSYSKLSHGYFDITVGPLVQLWGIGTDKARVPSSNEIKSALPRIGYQNVQIKDNKVKLKKDNMIIDLGGIAKGYAADEVAQYLKSKGVKRAIIDLGGNIYALGSKDTNLPWSVGIQNPFNEKRGDFIGIINVSNKSVVTSGVYERYFEKDGKKYHHILNPFTGYPVDNELMSVSIVSNDSIDGDALSTSVFALGVQRGYELVKSLENVEAIFVTKDKEIYITPNIKDNFKLKSKDFKVKTLK